MGAQSSVDRQARRFKLTPQERLKLRQQSQPDHDDYTIATTAVEIKGERVYPGLGKAIKEVSLPEMLRYLHGKVTGLGVWYKMLLINLLENFQPNERTLLGLLETLRAEHPNEDLVPASAVVKIEIHDVERCKTCMVELRILQQHWYNQLRKYVVPDDAFNTFDEFRCLSMSTFQWRGTRCSADWMKYVFSDRLK